MKKKIRIIRNHKRIIPMKVKKCAVCHTLFEGRNNQKFCSVECKSKNHNKAAKRNKEQLEKMYQEKVAENMELQKENAYQNEYITMLETELKELKAQHKRLDNLEQKTKTQATVETLVSFGNLAMKALK